MISPNPSHRTYADPSRDQTRPTMEMPKLTHSQMLAILRESGVPEEEARRWIEQDATLSSPS